MTSTKAITGRSIPELFRDKSECCGCAVCYSICPRLAIEMISDDQGFMYPKIMAEKCIMCYKCLKVCAFKKTAERIN